MAETVDNEAWMPKKASPAPRQEAYFDKASLKESLVESDEMSVSSLGSALAEDHGDSLIEQDNMDGWTITMQEVASITSEDKENKKHKQTNYSQKKDACQDTNFMGMTISDESLSLEVIGATPGTATPKTAVQLSAGRGMLASEAGTASNL
jgi:hypothetical protein